jgi:hypothetical protein
MALSFYTMGRKMARETDFVDNSVCTSVTNSYDSDGVVSLNATMQSKSNYVNIFEVQTENSTFESGFIF